MELKDKNIFISYAHGCHDELVERFTMFLRDAGYNVFMDKHYLEKGDWENIIDDHIITSKYFIFMVSAKAVSRGGYCLNELCRAQETGAEIIPVVLDSSLVPLSISRWQRIFLKDCIRPDGSTDEAVFAECVRKVQNIVSGKEKLGFADTDNMLRRCLKPMLSNDELSKHYSTFTGREVVFKAFEDFVNSDTNIMWIPASPGTGKTAFSAMLCWHYNDLVSCVHFCKFNNSDRSNPNRILASLAYQLAERIPEYRSRLMTLPEIENILDNTPEDIFQYLFIDPLCDLDIKRTHVVVIDALDEASLGGANKVCEVLRKAQMKNDIRPWLKFVLTSRNETEISSNFTNISCVFHDFDSTTYEDIRAYYQKQFPDINEQQMTILLNKSEGAFLYAVEITRQIKNNILDLKNINLFPPGIYGFYKDCMDRICDPDKGKGVTFEEIKPLLGFLCVFTDPATEDVIEDFLKMNEDKVGRLLRAISGLFHIGENGVQPVHKSLIDWLTTPGENRNNSYCISAQTGYQIIYDYLKEYYEAEDYLWESEIQDYLVKYYGRALVTLKTQTENELFRMLDNYEFISIRNSIMHFDTGLWEYINEIASYKIPAKIFRQETFKRIFEENRRLMYNSGMFFKLRSLKFTQYCAGLDFSLEGHIGVAFYYYIVEEFEKAISKCSELLQREEMASMPVYAAELLNVKGLSERKLVRFDDAKESFHAAIEKASQVGPNTRVEHSDAMFELSMSYLILGKIYTHLCEFDKADLSLDKAVEVLCDRISQIEDDDDRTAKTLFLAEEYRVYAHTCIWEGNYEKAQDMLDQCERIYREYKSSTDRYFIRYQYTSALLNLMTHKHVGTESRLLAMLTDLKGKYDEGTINEYLGLVKAIERNDEEVSTYIRKAYDIFMEIHADLELHEALMIEHVSRCVGSESDFSIHHVDNEYVRRWINYAGQKVYETIKAIN